MYVHTLLICISFFKEIRIETDNMRRYIFFRLRKLESRLITCVDTFFLLRKLELRLTTCVGTFFSVGSIIYIPNPTKLVI